MEKLKAVLFDLDGTLTDTLQDLTDGVNHALLENGMPTHTQAEVCRMVGNGVKNLVKRALPEGSSAEEEARVFACFIRYYSLHATDTTKPYPGVTELLAALKGRGIKLAVLSNKADAPTKEIVSRFFPNTFSLVLGQREGVPKKPDPTAVNEVLSAFGITKGQAAYVGDSEVDVKTAENAGIPCFAVTWGFREREELLSAGATRLYESAEGLLSALLSRID